MIFWKVESVDEADRDSANIEGNEIARRRLFLNFYRVWNLEQCAWPQAVSTSYPRSRCTSTLRSKPPKRSSRRCPTSLRFVTKAQRLTTTLSPVRSPYPLANSSRVLKSFYGTLGHECLHASGHQSRLNSESLTEPSSFGSPVYCGEELIAGMGAAFLCAEAGVSPGVIENQAAYVQGWLGKLRGNKRRVVIAAAQRAADYILNANGGGDSRTHRDYGSPVTACTRTRCYGWSMSFLRPRFRQACGNQMPANWALPCSGEM
jgi:antirestriction protein ArdC